MNPPVVETDRDPAEVESEAFQTLVGRIGRKGGLIPAEALARLATSVVPADEWPARVEAVDALLRRLESARKDELLIDARPADGRTLGLYATRRKGSTSRPYHTVVSGVDPIAGSCDCPDFLKNSLGVCKHVFAVLNHLYSRPRLLARGRAEQQEQAAEPAPEGLEWDPVRPLVGFGDWLDRVSWRGVPGAGGAPPGLFKIDARGRAVVKNAWLDAPEKRLAVVEALRGAGAASPGDRGHDPAVHALLAREAARLGRIVAGAVGPSNLKNPFRGLSRTLYPYQREGVRRFLKTTRLLLADDMGLGKTAQAIACCSVLWRAGRVKRGMIIAPAALKPQWAREWAQFSDMRVTVVEGPPDDRKRIYDHCPEGFLIINYEQLLRDLDVVRAWSPDLVVLDEAQRIKNWATKTALSVKGLNPPYRLVLTGTPMENRIEELASVVEWVDDMALEPKWRLPAAHAVRADGSKEVVGVRNLDTLRARLAPCMLRRVRQDVLDQLPSRTDVRVPVDLTEAQREEHDALDQPIARLVRKSFVRPLTQPEFLRLMSLLTTQRIISNGLAQLHYVDVWPTINRRKPEEGVLKSLSAPKLIELRQLIRQLVLDQGRKVVVFSQWRRMLHLANWAVGDLLAAEKLRAGFFTGAENPRRRTQNIVEFHDDPGFRVLFASDAGGVGLNLQRAANSVVNLELPWNPAVLEQRIGRIYRIGQTQPIDVYNLIAEQGIESRIAELVGSKQAFFKGLFDGQSDVVQFDNAGSFLSRVQKLYEDALPAAADGDADADAESEPESEPVDLADSTVDDDEDAVADPFDELVEAADESRDPAAEVDRPATAEPPSDGAVRQLFAQLSVHRAPDGHLVIEAPAEAADTLGSLFEGMAALLRASARPPG